MGTNNKQRNSFKSLPISFAGITEIMQLYGAVLMWQWSINDHWHPWFLWPFIWAGDGGNASEGEWEREGLDLIISMIIFRLNLQGFLPYLPISRWFIVVIIIFTRPHHQYRHSTRICVLTSNNVLFSGIVQRFQAYPNMVIDTINSMSCFHKKYEHNKLGMLIFVCANKNNNSNNSESVIIEQRFW